MPIRITNNTSAAGKLFANPFVGPASHPSQIAVDVSVLTSSEIDDYGWLKPGVAFTKAGTLIPPVAAVSSVAAAAAGAGNAGNGTVGSLLGKAGGVSEVVTLTAIDATHFSVVGSVSGNLGTATTGVAFVSGAINLTITAGGTPFAATDFFTLAVTGTAALQKVHGVTPEAINVLNLLPFDSRSWTQARDAAGVQQLVVHTIGALNRGIIESNLGRVLTTAEIAAFDGTPLRLLA